MTTWYDGWGWCNTLAHFPTMAILWAAILTGVAVAVGFAIGHRNDAATTGLAQPKGAMTARISRDDAGNDEFWRRLM